MVFNVNFHEKEMAAKCIWIEETETHLAAQKAESDLQENIHEYSIQLATFGSGILIPLAIFRQQDQERNVNGTWTALNYNIFIYPKFKCNLDQFHRNHFHQFTEEILSDIIHQCLIRICSS